jgi:Tol biopolymer transport system component/DNA-binding winged helix-turn-helix (wHTH) protein
VTTLNSSAIARFDDFEVDLRHFELRKAGKKIKVPSQPIQLLALLLERPGEVVSRQEIRERLWPDTFVDVDHSLSTAISKIREALEDSAANPRYVETLSRRGYRFIGVLQNAKESERTSADAGGGPEPPRTSGFLGTHATRIRILLGLVFVGVLILTFATVAYRHSKLNSLPRGLVAVPFTDYPGISLCPAISPDGSRIAFAWDSKHNSLGEDVYVRTIRDETLLRLTNLPSAGNCPAWSPDGTRIAFHRFAGDDSGIYVVSALGGTPTKLRATHPPSDSGWGTSWSSDAKWIAYSDSVGINGSSRVQLLATDTLQVQPVPGDSACIEQWQPAFSHSGDFLAYACLLKIHDHEIGIYVVSIPDGFPKLVTKLSTGWNDTAGITWTADDQHLVIARPHVGNDMELDQVTLADGGVSALPLGTGLAAPDMSAHGDLLAYVRFTSHQTLLRSSLTQPGRAAEQVMSSTYDLASAHISPDGKHVAFGSNRSGTWEIWMGDWDGTNLVRLSDASSSDAGAPNWSPDSQKVAFDSRVAGTPEIFIVDINERVPRKFVTNIPNNCVPSWSHDGKWLYFQALSEERIFRAPVSGGDAAMLSSESATFPLESFDGDTVYFFNRARGGVLYQTSVYQPSAAARVANLPALQDQSLYTVVPNGVYFVPAKPPSSIWFFDTATKRAHEVLKVSQPFVNGLSVSPDGRSILYNQDEGISGEIMLVKNFH